MEKEDIQKVAKLDSEVDNIKVGMQKIEDKIEKADKRQREGLGALDHTVTILCTKFDEQRIRDEEHKASDSEYKRGLDKVLTGIVDKVDKQGLTIKKHDTNWLWAKIISVPCISGIAGKIFNIF